jgi:phage virion morphogenesis protein
MSGVGLVHDFTGLDELQSRLKKLSRIKKAEILDIVGAQVESQTRRRIRDEKTDPSGNSWPAWSSHYAARRPAGRTLLMNEDHLLDSVTHLAVDSDSIEVGSNLIYAASHQFGDGDRGIPMRAYLGISEDNEKELLREMDEYLDKVIKR